VPNYLIQFFSRAFRDLFADFFVSYFDDYHLKVLPRASQSKDDFTQNPFTAYNSAYGQRQSSHKLRWPYPAEFSRFRRLPADLKLF